MTTSDIIILTEELQELKAELRATIEKNKFNTRMLNILRDIKKDYEIHKFLYTDYFTIEWDKHAEIKKELENKIMELDNAITEKEKELYNATMSII